MQSYTSFLKTFSHTLKYPRQEKRSAIQLDAFGIHFRKNGILSEKKTSGIIFTKNHLGPTARPHPSLSWSDVTAKARVISLSLPSGCLVLYPSPLWLSVGFAFRADHPSQTWCQKQVLGQLNNAYTIVKLLYKLLHCSNRYGTKIFVESALYTYFPCEKGRQPLADLFLEILSYT